MSMTREEIIKAYESAVFSNALSAAAGNEEAARDYELLKAGLDALRGPTREQVEKMWSGCEYCTGDVNDRPYLDLHSKRYYIDEFGILTDENEDNSISELNFCPVCGRPLTDEALEIAMERLEALESDARGTI